MGINNFSLFNIKTSKGQIKEIKYAENQPLINGDIFKSSIKSFKRLSSGENVKQIYEIWFQTVDSDLIFEPGDTIAILAPNRLEEVNRLVSRLKLKDQADLRCDIEILNDGTKKMKIPSHIPLSATSIRNILTYFIELRAVPKKQLITALCEFTTKDAEKKILEIMSTSDYENQILIPRLSIWDVLEKVPSCDPPLELLLEYIPRLRPRPYSIANSPLYGEKKNSFRIIFSLEDFKENQTGLVSGWLVEIGKKFRNDKILNINDEELENAMSKLILYNNNEVSMYLRKVPKPFRLPKDLSKNIIMIGAGTGIAPFIGFLEHLDTSQYRNPIKLGDIWLIFGCRYPNRDDIYKEQLDQFLHSNILKKLMKAFSRNGCGNSKYVQDIIIKNKDEFISQFLNEDTYTYVCGNINLCKEVSQIIINIIGECKGIPQNESKILVENLKKNKKFIEEIWT